MIKIGQINRLQVGNDSNEGWLLNAGEHGSILLPHQELDSHSGIDSYVDAFVFHNHQNKLIATTQKPFVMVGEFANLKVVALTNVGAFLHWGLAKDLLLPYGEQRYELQEGQSVLVRVLLDPHTQRIVATTRIDNFLEEEASGYSVGQTVKLLIAGKTDLGFKAIVNNSHWGVLYNNELFQPLKIGQSIDGYIKKVRADHKLDVSLYAPGYTQVNPVCEQIINVLKQHDGFIMMTDKSSPESVYSVFKVSKKVYKKALGALYKQRRILIEKQGIRLIK